MRLLARCFTDGREGADLVDFAPSWPSTLQPQERAYRLQAWKTGCGHFGVPGHRIDNRHTTTKASVRRTVGRVKMVEGVSFAIGKGQALGHLGASGCGKSVVAG